VTETSSPQITRLRLALALGPLIAVGPLAIDTYLPALPAMADSYGVRVTDVERSVSLYVMGTALGQLLGGPLSDHLGRKPVAWGGLLLFALASLLISLSTALWQLDLLRVIQALGGGATVVVAAVGAMLVLLQGWQAIFIGLAGYALLMVVWVAKVMPTHIPVAVDRRLRDVAKGWGRVLSHRAAMAIILANGLSFSTLFAFITDSAFVYLRIYAVGETAFPLLFGANVATMILFNRVNLLLLRRIPAIRLMTAALIIQVSAAWLLLLTVLILGKPPLWLLVPLIMLAGGAVAMVIPNAIACFTHYFPHDSGAATGINGSLQFFLAGMTGILMTSLHNHSLLPLGLAMALAATLALTLQRAGRTG
jgi:DHA1 family bicyclomycin/chloramphenicol resistance-like MFS transporter